MATGWFISRFSYLGIILLLVLGGLGLPVPEEAPIILAAVLAHKGQMIWWLALTSCFIGVLLGDFVVYALGYVYGERVLSLPLTRRFLTRAREAQMKGYFHRHGIKILILGRFAMGFRTAAYLTAGILRLPAARLFLADLFAATATTVLMFGMGYFFADWVESRLKDARYWLPILIGAAIVIVLLWRYVKERRRAGLPVGPPVPVTDEVPLPPDDLLRVLAASPAEPNATEPTPPAPASTPTDAPSNTELAAHGSASPNGPNGATTIAREEESPQTADVGQQLTE